jgi:hypothetical protein
MTAWLANYFTYGDSFCFHDGLAGCRTPETYKEKLQSISVNHVGDSDSGLLFVDLAYMFPDSPVVIIKRDILACKESYEKKFGKIPDIAWGYMDTAMKKHKGLIVDFRDIPARLDEISEYCIGQKLPQERKEFLLNLNIQIIQNKAELSFLTEGY